MWFIVIVGIRKQLLMMSETNKYKTGWNNKPWTPISTNWELQF